MNKGRTPIASSAAAAALVLAIGWGSATPAPSPAPGDNAGGGGSLPVVPVGGIPCIVGLNCGCIRNVTCPDAVRRHPRPPANIPPPDAPGAPGPGGG
jgi:hypothetical protein